MELPKPLNEMTDEEIDALDVELLSDEEIEEIEQKLKAMFTPEELDALLNPVEEIEEIREEDIVHYKPSEKHKKFMEELLQRHYDEIVGKKPST